MAPTYMPSNAEKASTAGIPKVRGISRATPMAAVSPGSAPKMMPRVTPIRFASREPMEMAFMMPSRMFANINPLQSVIEIICKGVPGG